MNVSRSWLARTTMCATLAIGTLAHPAVAQQVTARDDDAASRRAMEALLDRKVSVALDNVSLTQAIKAVADEAHVTILYQRESIAKYARSVTLRMTDESLRSVFLRLFQGTALQIVARPHERLVVIDGAGDGTPVDDAAQDGGEITGQVCDSAGVPIGNVRVALRGTKRVVETNAQGRFQFTDVPIGTYVVTANRLGYAPDSRPVKVEGSESVSITLTLRTTLTRLTEVVTTATGNQARLKVGNDVGTINADSLVQNTLVRNMSDLLTAHTPGVQVTPTSGAVGAPTRIRIRGISSPQLNNDPIVVVDGVRVNAQTTANTINYLGSGIPLSQVNTGSTKIGGFNVPAPSPLDQIDPNMIESIDVLKGPTATALYGPDASTGVVVIKTKAGRSGPWRYHLGGDYGWIVPPRTYPLRWTGWGHPPGGPSQPNCPLATNYSFLPSQLNGGCVFDSVTAFNPQNDPQMTTVGTGYNRSVVMDVSGGGSTVQGFVQGDYSDAIGQQRLPLSEQRRLARVWAEPVPSWLVRPNGQINTHLLTKISAQFTPQFDIAVTGQGTYQVTRNNGTGINPSDFAPLGPGDTLVFLPTENLLQRITSSSKRGIGTANARYQPISWLVFTGTGGLDYAMRDDQQLRRDQDCSTDVHPTGCGGFSSHYATRTEILVPSFTVGATGTYGMAGWLTAHTAFGEQYSRTQTYSMGVGAFGLALGQNLITGADFMDTPTEATDEGASAGWYAEQQFGVNDRFFLTAALRRDASSAFGKSIATPTFPKYGASWLVSSEPFFPRQNILTQVRVRTAYGESGKQGSQTDVLRNFFYGSGLTGDGTSGPVLILSGLGNPQLQPQRDREWEGGFDLGFYNDRATMTATWYHKQSSNAIIAIGVPPSPGATSAIQATNVGAIRNTGYELQLSLRPIETRFMSWDFNVQASKNNNLLVNKGNVVDLPNNSGGVIRAGYPLFGLWQRPIVAYGDYNGDGLLQDSEIAFADSQVYVGSTDPNGTFAYSNSLTFLGGRFRFNSLVNQVKGLGTRLQVYSYKTRGMVDPTASIPEQAAARQAMIGEGYLGTVSYVDLAELSASFTLPTSVSKRFHSQSATVTVAGRNLASWSNYRGADPTTTSADYGPGSDGSTDDGTGLSQPRNWVVRLNFLF